MIPTWVKVTGSFIAGAAIGALITHLYYKETINNTVDRKVFMIVGKQDKEKPKDLVTDEIESTRLPDQPAGLDLKNVSAGDVDYTAFFNVIDPKPKDRYFQSVEEAVEGGPSEDDDYLDDYTEEYLDSLRDEADNDERANSGPRVMTLEEARQPNSNTFKEFYYWPETGRLTDIDTEEEIDDMRSMVGDLLLTTGFASSDERDAVIFIENNSLGEWYEITKAY